MKNKLRNSLLILTFALVGFYFFNATGEKIEVTKLEADVAIKTKKKTQEERMLFSEERERHEFNLQKNPITGKIPFEEKEKEFLNSLVAKEAKENSSTRVTTSTYTSRGPTNFGGRTRAMAVDISDGTSNTILAGGVTSGMFRTTNGGASWTKVSPNDEIHSVTAIAQDPTNTNIWYYGTGESIGSSGSLGSFLLGDGIWRSTDGGITWSEMTGTGGDATSYDSFFDIVLSLEVHPTTGDLFAAVGGAIRRFDQGTSTWSTEIANGSINSARRTDVVITSTGRVYAAFGGSNDAGVRGVWTSANGEGSWTRINTGSFTPSGRMVLSTAPSNSNIIYALFMNDGAGTFDADLWKYDAGTTTWTDYSSKLPDEPGGDLVGNDPFTAQGGYDLVVSVKPDDEDFVLIGGSNAYKIEDITTDLTFLRIGGYNSNANYALYPNHHPDIHVLEFDPNNSNIMFSGTDGGVHKTTNITNPTIA